MKLSANRSDLLPILKKLRTVVPRTFENAATDCIMTEADTQSKSVIFTAVGRDCSLQIRHNCACSVEESGSALVLASVLERAVSLFADEATRFLADGTKIVLRNKTAEYEFPHRDISKFPKPPVLSVPDALFDCADLPQVVSQTLFSTSVTEDKPALQCIHMVMHDSEFTAETCDGNRMTMLKREGSPQGNFEMLIPGTTMRILESILKDQKTCKIGLMQNTALFLCPNMVFTAKTMAHTQFVDLQKLVGSHSAASSVRIEGNILLLALKQIGVGQTKNARVLMRTKHGEIALQLLPDATQNQKQKISAETVVPAEIEAPMPSKGFCYNYGFLCEALKTMSTESLLLQFDKGGALAIQLENRVHLLMPMRYRAETEPTAKQTKTKKTKSAA